MEHLWLELPYCSNNSNSAPMDRFGFKQKSLEQFVHVQFTCLDKKELVANCTQTVLTGVEVNWLDIKLRIDF